MEVNMDFFDKATRVAKNVGDNVKNSAKTVYNSTKEQSELAGLNVQKANIERKLNTGYAEIGKRYVEYIALCDTEAVFQVDDIMESMQSDLEKLDEVKTQIADMEAAIKQNNLEKLQKKSEEEYQSEKRKLDKALEMDIISAEDYDVKLAAAQKKLDNYEVLRKLELQYEMDIITKAEYKEKVKAVLE